jgi:hypothetical protein
VEGPLSAILKFDALINRGFLSKRYFDFHFDSISPAAAKKDKEIPFKTSRPPGLFIALKADSRLTQSGHQKIKETHMPKSTHKKTKTSLPPIEKEPKLLKEEMDESRQEIEEAGYSIGLNRKDETKDESDDWQEAEKEVDDEEKE